MSESAPPDVPGCTVEAPSLLTAESIERLLNDFRGWLYELSAVTDTPAQPAKEAPDLHTLLGQMIAIRQEVNLQTKTVRAQQEQNTETLRMLGEVIEELQQTPRTPVSSPDDALRPLLKSLLDTQDALMLAFREANRVQETVTPLLQGKDEVSAKTAVALPVLAIPPLQQPPLSWLARVLGVSPISPAAIQDWQDQVRHSYQRAAEETRAAERRQHEESAASWQREQKRAAQLLASLVEGYRMGLQRIERALQQHGCEAIPALGEVFDPERMEVIEAVSGSGKPAGEVLEEVRRGYLWRGRVFRFAQVRVARS